MYNDIFKELNNINEELLCEMAIINPYLCDQGPIQIEVEQRNEGPIPHMHVYLDHTRDKKNCAYIRLDKAEYMPKHDSTPLGKSKDEFIKIMTSEWDGYYFKNSKTGEIRTATGYEMAVKIWVDTYEHISIEKCNKFKFDENGNLIMPDYSKL